MKFLMRKLCREQCRFLVVAVLVVALGAGIARSDSAWTQTSQADFESGILFQVDTSSSPGDVKLVKAVAGSSYTYAFRGGGRDDFWKYDVPSNSWTPLADAPRSVGAGGALAHDGSSYIYALRGGYKDDFWRYDISAGSWTGFTDTPRRVNAGGALAYDGNSYVYAL